MLAGLYPMTFILQRFKTQYVFGPIVMMWAITCAATAGVKTWQGLFAQRFFLGAIFPTVTFISFCQWSNISDRAQALLRA